MRFDILSLFPEIVSAYCNESILGMALERGICEINLHNPRDFSKDKHKKVDDTPYGGGAGMLLSVQPYYDCLLSILGGADVPRALPEAVGSSSHGRKALHLDEATELIIFSPRGETLNQSMVASLAQKKQLIMLCGRYEGFDERLYSLATREISLGDFILTGGELAAMAVVDSVVRLLPTALGDEASYISDSFSCAEEMFNLRACALTKAERGRLESLVQSFGISSIAKFEKTLLLEHPHYTRPKDYLGMMVPDVLQSGDHKRILFWRIEEALKMTRKRRPDLLSC